MNPEQNSSADDGIHDLAPVVLTEVAEPPTGEGEPYEHDEDDDELTIRDEEGGE